MKAQEISSMLGELAQLPQQGILADHVFVAERLKLSVAIGPDGTCAPASKCAQITPALPGPCFDNDPRRKRVPPTLWALFQAGCRVEAILHKKYCG